MTKTVLDEIKHALMATNAVQGEQEFCVAWLGKNASYMRVLRFQQLQPSADALAVCASKLNYYRVKLECSSEARHRAWAERFAALHEKCAAALNEQAEAKWRVAERMGAA